MLDSLGFIPVSTISILLLDTHNINETINYDIIIAN